MKKQYISPSFIEVKLQGVGIIAGSDAKIITNDSGDPFGESLDDMGGEGNIWDNAAVKGFTSQNLWDEEW